MKHWVGTGGITSRHVVSSNFVILWTFWDHGFGSNSNEFSNWLIFNGTPQSAKVGNMAGRHWRQGGWAVVAIATLCNGEQKQWPTPYFITTPTLANVLKAIQINTMQQCHLNAQPIFAKESAPRNCPSSCAGTNKTGVLRNHILNTWNFQSPLLDNSGESLAW